LCLVFPVLLRAASPDELKRHAFETIDRNADRIALLGDSLFYFGELGMQEFESTKLIKEPLVDGDDTKETKYFSLLPPDATPPLELNREMMEKFRPEMRKFYLNKPVQFR